MSYGLTAEGFVPKTTQIAIAEMVAALRAVYGTSVMHEKSALYVFVAIVAERLGELWEVGEQINASQDPDAATKTALDALCALTGTLRRAATKSAVTLTLTGTNATLVPTGSQAKTASTNKVFTTLANATLVTLTAWAPTTVYAVGNRRTNAGRSYVCITAGTSAGAGGPTTTAADITDNTVHWRYIGEGAAAVDVAAEASETGPTVALSGDITSIVTPVSGWSSVRNLLDAEEGTNVETDETLRLRRVLELSQAGTSTPDAIRAAVLDVEGVTACTVFYNNTDVTDADGVPPHAVEVLVRGGVNQDIFDCLLANVAAGIATHGTTSGTATDSEGVSHTVKFSRPTEIAIWVILDAVVHNGAGGTFPSDGSTQIKQAIVDWGDDQATGRNAVSSRVAAQAMTIEGVLEVPTLPLIGTVNPPTVSTTIAISSRQLATYDTSRITVNLTTGTP